MQNGKMRASFVRYLAIFGCVSTGLVYTAIGVIAILSFLQVKEGGADESSLLVFLDRFLIGKIFIWLILLGMVSYITWRIYESIMDPYHYGKEAKGIATRTGIALSTVADAFIAYSAIETLLGMGNVPENGQPVQQRQIVSNMLEEHRGHWIIMSIGITVAITAVVQLIYGISRGYRERLNTNRLKPATQKLIDLLAWLGHIARGIILGIIGFFLIKAGASGNAQQVVNTDKAFDFIGDHVGHLYFILVAIGTICYGLFMFALGANYNSEEKA